MLDLNTTLGGGRFVLLRKLGVGGMGSVYEALDQKRNVHVALKSLGQIDAVTVGSFKAEFRDFQHLHHPNLVVLDEFFSEGNEWHFTMELLTGKDLLSHVRHALGPASDAASISENLSTELLSAAERTEASPRGSGRVRVYPGSVDIAALRETLRQLAAGLAHLHSAGKVHRDVKSSNVIITDDGRTVLLDFGVSVDIRGKGVQLAGTPLYMAPELFWHSATPAADWYSVGVLLYQALTGMDPWQGGGISGLVTTKRPPPVHPSELDPSVPEELGELCLSLLEANPKHRAGRRAILDWIDQDDLDASSQDTDEAEETDVNVFIGRGRELASLRRAFDALPIADEPLVVFVQGETGIGKSALVENFVSTLDASDPPTVLRGRVLEEEVVPYKSVDGIIDALGEQFLELGYERVKPLLPEHFNIVADVFPVLRRSAAVAELPRTAIPDPNERRTLMFVALKECLRRLSERTNLVLLVDDLQWSDADSLQLWNDLLRAPGAPRMLFIATLRSDRSGSIRPSRRPPSFVQNLAGSLPSLPIPTTSLWLARLSEDESLAYVEARASSRNSIVPEDVVHAASGHPLFLDELIRYRGHAIKTGELTLQHVLRGRIEQLEPEQRTYLQLACVAAKPLPRGLYSKAAGLSHGAGLRAFKSLRAARLIRTGRTTGPDGDDWVDALHDQVRNACIANCSDDERAALHRAIATTMESEARLDAEQLVVEWRQAGDREKTAHYAVDAGDASFHALAFAKAADFYAEALELSEDRTAESRVRLQERYGRSLRNAGKARAAADVFLPLAALLPDDRAFSLRCETTELLLRSGYVDEAIVVAKSLLTAVDESLPRGSRAALAGLAWGRIRIGVGRHRWKPRTSYAPRELRKLDALWSVSLGLGSIEQLPSFALCARYVYLSLELGEPMRVARAFAMESLTAAAQGAQADAAKYGAEAKVTAALVPQAASELAIVWSAEALAAVMTGRWTHALDSARSAKLRIQKECVGAVGESSMAVEAELWALAATGQYAELYRAATRAHAQAEKNDDLYASIAASSGLPNLAWVAHDEAARAITVTSSITARWSQRGVYVQHLFDAYARAQAHLYLNEASVAAECFAEFDRKAKGTLILVPHMMRVFRAELECRIALSLLFASPNPTARLTVTRHLKKLRQLKAEWGAALALLVEAGRQHADGTRTSAARTARSAASALAKAGMSAHSAAALAYSERLDGRAASVENAGLGARGVVDPAAFIALLVPGYEHSAGAPKS